MKFHTVSKIKVLMKSFWIWFELLCFIKVLFKYIHLTYMYIGCDRFLERFENIDQHVYTFELWPVGGPSWPGGCDRHSAVLYIRGQEICQAGGRSRIQHQESRESYRKERNGTANLKGGTRSKGRCMVKKQVCLLKDSSLQTLQTFRLW